MRASIVFIAVAAVFSTSAFAQWENLKTPGVPRLPNGKLNEAAPAPRTADGKPDLSGVWETRGYSGERRYGLDYDVAQSMPAGTLTPFAQSVRLKNLQNLRKDNPLSRCLPVSVSFLNLRSVTRFVQTPGLIVALHESPNSPHRMIFLDGRELPKDPSPTWLGYSVGRWEGDTLVVTTTGFNDQGWLDVGGTPQTESLKLTERFRRPDFGHMEYEVTFEDPKVFTRPATARVAKRYMADTEIMEDVCENEKDSQHLTAGTRLSAEMLAKYAGTYTVAGRDVAVVVADDQLTVKDTKYPADQVFAASSENHFSSSLGYATIAFVKDASGAITHFTRTDGKISETAVRKK
ncbi:MAG: hypothetical protein EXQ47_09950 [Bryobacterales bacterium]|nr:hypothetical protein [Bryobacterales bacterium]